MKKYLILAIAALLAGCSPKKESTDESTVAEEPIVQGLTPELKADGWKLLFDGKSLDGWRFYQGKENTKWDVVDGTMHCKPGDTTGYHVDILTIEQYENFELAFDWKISSGGNSGLIYRATEAESEPYYTGPEFQLMDDAGWKDPLKDVQLTGASYDMYAPTENVTKPAGEWNSAKLVLNGKHVEHWLNGTKVVEYELSSDDWNKRKAASKWKDSAGYGIQPTGHIDFQDHDHEISFKNIMIKVL
jgi:hypothetical protein